MIKKISIWIIMILIGVGIGYYNAPEKVKTVTKVKVKTEIQEKIRTKTIVQELPSGEKRTTIVYQNDKVTKSDRSRSETKTIERKKLDWGVSGGPRFLAVDRRIIGTLSVGGYVTVTKQYNLDQYGVYLRYSF